MYRIRLIKWRSQPFTFGDIFLSGFVRSWFSIFLVEDGYWCKSNRSASAPGVWCEILSFKIIDIWQEKVFASEINCFMIQNRVIFCRLLKTASDANPIDVHPFHTKLHQVWMFLFVCWRYGKLRPVSDMFCTQAWYLRVLGFLSGGRPAAKIWKLRAFMKFGCFYLYVDSMANCDQCLTCSVRSVVLESTWLAIWG